VLVEVWSDVVCPWCYIGKRRFERALALLADDPEFEERIDVVYQPFQLDPTAPPGGTTPVAEAYARKFGGPQRAAQIIDHLTTTAAVDGLEFRLDLAQRANTRDAHRLLWYANTHGPSGSQEQLKERLLQLYFMEGANVADPDVLARAAAAVGLDEADAQRALAGDDGSAELAELLAFAAEAGITAVPTYVLDGRWSIPGAQDPDVFVQVIKRLTAADRVG